MMNRPIRFWRWVLLACLALAGTAFAEPTEPLWVDQDASGNSRVHLYFFWSETCPHCQAAHPFVEAIPRERPWVVLHALEVSRSDENARRFEAMAQAIGQRAEAVPTFMVCGWMEVGWQDEASSGVALLRAIDACRAGGVGTVVPTDQSAIDLPLLGKVDATTLSLPVFTLVIASLDAFNPCAFFVLLFLLSLLANQKDRRRMLTVGAIFIAASGLMYFAFMAAWLNLFQVLGHLAWVTLAAGVLALIVGVVNVKDFFWFGRGVSLSIPEHRKPAIYQRARAILAAGSVPAMLAATVLLAVAVNFYELLCTAGFPMVYTRLLTLRDAGPAQHYLYLGLYNLVYVIPLAVIVTVFAFTLGARKLSEREGRLLKLLSGLMMLQLGALLVLAPNALNRLGVAFALIAVSVGLTWLAARLTRR